MKKQFFRFPLAMAVACTAISVSYGQQKGNAPLPDPLVSHIDKNVKPGDDFFQYANGKWFKENPIPPTEQSNGIFQLIQDTINAQVRNICESSAALKQVAKGSNKQKIGDFFFSGMDSISINKNGLNALKPVFNKISEIKDLNDLSSLSSYLMSIGVSNMFDFGVGQDDKMSSKNVVRIWQGGLSLPDRRFYFDTDAHAVDIRLKFSQHLTHTFLRMGYKIPQARLAAAEVMKLETDIARTSRKREDTRDPLSNYNKLSLHQLKKDMPDFNWTVFLKEAGLPVIDSVVVGQPEFLTALNTYLKSNPLKTWKNYFRYHLLRSYVGNLDDKTYREFFSFYSSTLRGIEKPKPRWKRVVTETNGMLGDLVGQVYVAEYLPAGTKEKLLEIGHSIKNVYAERIKNLDWMGEATKQKALHKLDVIIMKMGYPDKWKDMSSVQINRTSYVQNEINVNRWYFNYNISKYGKPVDRTEWGMQPQDYNAYYNPSNNEICVPGCNIIIPGYEGRMADDALLYSVIGGSTIGHEITHGFDDQGSKYNELGNLDNWWTSEDSIKFSKKTKMIVSQFNNYIAVDSLHINGELTQGENIADLGGILMGYEAFKKTSQYQNQEIVAGLDPVKRFFLGYAMAWMVNERPAAIANQVRSNEHSPARFRVIGPLTNMPEFDQAFGIKEGDPMWRDNSVRVKIW